MLVLNLSLGRVGEKLESGFHQPHAEAQASAGDSKEKGSVSSLTLLYPLAPARSSSKGITANQCHWHREAREIWGLQSHVSRNAIPQVSKSKV